MEWKKIATMEYEKIIFHFIPCPVDGNYATEKLLTVIEPMILVPFWFSRLVVKKQNYIGHVFRIKIYLVFDE